MRSWEAAQARLAPVIGESGFRILFARSVHLTRRKYPWLGNVADVSDTPLAGLKSSLEGESEDQALAATRALHETFTGLLRALIGEALSDRLLEPTRPDSAQGQ